MRKFIQYCPDRFFKTAHIDRGGALMRQYKTGFVALVVAFLFGLISPAARAGTGIAGSWYGGYDCGEISEAWLDLAQDGRDIWGTFRFRTQDGVTGSFKMVGKKAIAGNFWLEGVEWVQQPANFRMIDLEGEISFSGKEMNGEVKTEGCKGFWFGPRPEDKPRPE
jgi:hypothetical protein